MIEKNSWQFHARFIESSQRSKKNADISEAVLGSSKQTASLASLKKCFSGSIDAKKDFGALFFAQKDSKAFHSDGEHFKTDRIHIKPLRTVCAENARTTHVKKFAI